MRGPFLLQRDALDLARSLVARLPACAVWSLFMTEGDDPDSPAALNIWADSHVDRLRMRAMLRLSNIVDHSETHESYQPARGLMVSIIQENDERDPRSDD